MKRLHLTTYRAQKLATLIASLLSLTACASGPSPHAGTTFQTRSPEYQFAETQHAAEAAARRAGDEQMSCADLEIEMTKLSSDPAMLAAMASNAAQAKAITDTANSTAATMNGLSALSLAGSLPVNVPGINMLGSAVGYAQRATMDAQMAKQDQATATMMDNVAAMQPAIYRRLRVMELAQARSCAFLS